MKVVLSASLAHRLDQQGGCGEVITVTVSRFELCFVAVSYKLQQRLVIGLTFTLQIWSSRSLPPPTLLYTIRSLAPLIICWFLWDANDLERLTLPSSTASLVKTLIADTLPPSLASRVWSSLSQSSSAVPASRGRFARDSLQDQPVSRKATGENTAIDGVSPKLRTQHASRRPAFEITSKVGELLKVANGQAGES